MDSREKQSDQIGIVVGRPIHGVTINDLEYILDDEGGLMHFPGMGSARNFLEQQGVDPSLEELHYLYHTYCLNCGEEYFLRATIFTINVRARRMCIDTGGAQTSIKPLILTGISVIFRKRTGDIEYKF